MKALIDLNQAHTRPWIKVTHATSQAAEALSEKGEQLQNLEQHLVKNCRGYTHDNPITSLGIAVGVGFLLSRLLRSH
jgi:ElaB/YqjD/DUF883 family membrane-anchored ribosome-binding protein